LSKVAVTYWNNTQAIPMPVKSRTKSVKRTASAGHSTTPQWFVFAVIASITLMLCLTINLRAFSEMTQEAIQFHQLSTEIERLNNENLAIQEEIHSLKSDPRAIEREARKIGMSRPNEKILVPVN
jgi:cell division protein FtsB